MRAGVGMVVALAAGILLALTACTSGAPGTEPRTWGASNPMNPPTHPHIARYCPDEPANHFDGDPEGYDTVYVCTVEDVPPSQNGLPRTKQTVDRISPDAVVALLRAYAAPDAKPTDDACPAMMADPLVIWIVEGDDVVAVRAPVDGCGFPTDEATTALQDAPRYPILVAREADIDG